MPRRNRPDAPDLSTTSAAILGLIAVEAGTAYDLARRMEKNHRFIWPRAESKLYEEVKRLEKLGLARATRGATGRRPRTVYSILPAGTAALGKWVGTASEAPSLSFETLVKLAYADHGTIADARAQVRAIADLAERWSALGIELAGIYLRKEAKLFEREHLNALVWRFLAHYTIALRKWAIDAERIIARWDGTRWSPHNAEVTRDVLREGLRELVGEHAAKRPGSKRRRKPRRR